MIQKPKIADLIKELVHKRGFTLTEIHKATGLNPVTVANVIKGKDFYYKTQTLLSEYLNNLEDEYLHNLQETVEIK